MRGWGVISGIVRKLQVYRSGELINFVKVVKVHKIIIKKI